MTQEHTGATQPYTLARFSALLEALYDGPGEAPPWAGFLRELRAELDASICFLILRSPAPGDPGLLLSDGLPSGLSGQSRNIYSDGLYALDPFVNLPPGEVVSLAEFLRSDSLKDSDFYRRCLQPFDIEHILGVDMQLAEGMRANLRVTRAPGAAAFNDQDKAGIRLLLPHLGRSIQYYVQLQSMEVERSLLDHTVSQLSVGTVFLDDQRRILQANRVAGQVLAQGAGLLRKGDTLALRDTVEAQAFRDVLANALDAHRSGQPHIVQAMSVTRPDERLPLNLVIRPLPVATRLEGQAHPAVVVFISDPETHSRTSGEILGQLYGLTPAEARLSLALADGQSLDEVSDSLCISRNTARAHLRAIFAKTGVTQQTKLVSLVLKSVAAVAGDSESTK